jgi:ribonuclease T1
MSTKRPQAAPLWRNPVTLVTSVLAIVAVIALSWLQHDRGEPGAPGAAGDQTASTTSATLPGDVGTDPDSGLPLVEVADLPGEARDMLALIASGGPFPYDRDGVVFENRERLLPDEDTGYYHEYTVPTPGSDDRGARRVIAGSSGELYYTDDHYVTFERIVP